MKILIVDDVLDNIQLLERVLRRRGHQTLTAENGLEGLNLTKSFKPDLIFMDLSMPVMSGLEATQAIREDPNICQTPIIAVTAHAMESDLSKCLEAGCNAVATKPIDFQKIDELIAQYGAIHSQNETKEVQENA